MKNGFESEHWLSEDGVPTGGVSYGVGFAISWQNGALAETEVVRKKPNGAFVEDIIDAAKDRLKAYQATKFNCEENAKAIEYLDLAMDILNERTKNREIRGVEGKHVI